MESAEVANNAASHPQIELTSGKRNAVLFAVLLGLFLSALDQNVVGTALPRIVTDLHGSGLYTWVVTSYLLSSTITVPIYGKLSDIYGRKPLLLIGVSIFLIGSILCGLSQDMTQLILFRVCKVWAPARSSRYLWQSLAICSPPASVAATRDCLALSSASASCLAPSLAAGSPTM